VEKAFNENEFTLIRGGQMVGVKGWKDRLKLFNNFLSGSMITLTVVGILLAVQYGWDFELLPNVFWAGGAKQGLHPEMIISLAISSLIFYQLVRKTDVVIAMTLLSFAWIDILYLLVTPFNLIGYTRNFLFIGVSLPVIYYNRRLFNLKKLLFTFTIGTNMVYLYYLIAYTPGNPLILRYLTKLFIPIPFLLSSKISENWTRNV
jgi:hypothetical protein